MRCVQLNDIYLNIFTMLIGRSVPEADHFMSKNWTQVNGYVLIH